ncbi:S41 family peptidase [Phaeocystidibacter luteus]|uniref:S41 family peptidase n=1 Tax=Phaeocystidibacter luteus TaxID=911197 RepID=A0A6N6RI86_9FLAO|nr:S41 family peptidase [Phaeocystidibacter luteus]KAB2814032.1 S41 family peptidase [Phaeocystidibacter luteus]
MRLINSTAKKVAFVGALVLMTGIFSAWKLDYFEINKQLDIFTNLFREVNMYYVDETEPSMLMEDAINEMLNDLDPYTVYIPEDDVENFRIQQTGQYGGIGATIRVIGDYVAIEQPYKGFAADNSGLKAGDLIISIDGKDMKGAKTSDVSALLKGTPGSTAELTVRRYGEDMQITLTREEIQVKSVPYYGMLNETTGYIVLRSFTNKASPEIKAAIQDLKNNHGMQSLVLDLRGNPGGLLNEAINVSNLFIDKGQEVVSTRGRIRELDQVYRTLRNPLDTEMELAVLIDQSSASASEIVAGTIQDLDRGVIVGRRSFGKGLVQQSRPLSYGAQVKITIAKYYTPSGRCIQAINYAERNEDGSVARIPDSLRTSFTTQNGRTVLDGGGIDPDVDVEFEKMSGILYSLIINGHLFEYATEYVRTHPEISAPAEFSLSEAEYGEFVNFLSDKEYHYDTETEKFLERLKKAAERENYNEDLADEIATLERAVADRKDDDLQAFKDQIKHVLEREIVGRYYYESGEIEFMLRDDETVLEAIRLLNDRTAYDEILSPKG